MMNPWSRMQSWLRAAAVSESDDEEQKLNKALLIFASSLMGFAAVLWVSIYWNLGLKYPANVPLIYQLVSVTTLIVYLKNRNFALFRICQLSLFLFTPFIMQWSIGNFVTSSGVMLWALLAPIGAMVLQGYRESIPWFVAYLVLTVLSGGFDYYLADDKSGLPMKTIAVFFVLNFAVISVMVFLIFGYFVREKEKIKARLDEQHLLLQAEQDRSERLLLNILPAPIAERLKRQHQTIADGFSDVTVMFADIVNFTRLTEEMAPSEVVVLLNDLFSELDGLAEKFGLEKIKTIGDAYMLAGGLDPEKPHYTDAVADMALELRELVAHRKKINGEGLQVRIGIGTGPVVAGVIGRKRFIYDIWGDTVNMANRMTAEAAPGCVQVDVTTYKRLRNRYLFDPPQNLVLKGKGEVTVFRLLHRKSDEDGSRFVATGGGDPSGRVL